MSLFMPQQKIPFQAVINFLRAYPPSCETPPAEWARQHMQSIENGDFVVAFEAQLDALGTSDSDSELGVAAGDEFKALQLVLVSDDGNCKYAVILDSDGYSRSSIEDYLRKEAESAKANNAGFYYAIVRSNNTVDKSALAMCLNSLSENGGRITDGIDLAYALFDAAGLLTDRPAGLLDIAGFGCQIFLGKMPSSRSRQPDFRSVLFPVAASSSSKHQHDEGRTGSNDEDGASQSLASGRFLSTPAASPPPPPGPVGLPKLPSFLSRSSAASTASSQAPGAPPSEAVEMPIGRLASISIPTPPPLKEPDMAMPAATSEPGILTPPPLAGPPPLIQRAEISHSSSVDSEIGVGSTFVPTPPPLPSPPTAQAASSSTTAASTLSGEGPVDLLASLGAKLESAASEQKNALAPTDLSVTSISLPLVDKTSQDIRDAELPARSSAKEPPVVKSGVAGLVSKLEQQASKASAKLESQVEDIQNRLTDELKLLQNKLEGAQKRSIRSAEGLRINLTNRMDDETINVKTKVSEAAAVGSQTVKDCQETGTEAMVRKSEELRALLLEAFDEVKICAENLTKTFDQNIGANSSKSIAELQALGDSLKKQMQELYDEYVGSIEASRVHLTQRLDVVNKLAVATSEGRFEYLHEELLQLKQRCEEQMSKTKDSLLSRISKEIMRSQTMMSQLQGTALEERILPRLQQHRAELRQTTNEFQHKLGEDLQDKGRNKISEFEPLMSDRKRRMTDLRQEADEIKTTVTQHLKGSLDEIVARLNDFAVTSIEQAQNVHKQTEAELSEIDRAIRVLADQSSIEGDMKSLNERNSVLDKLAEVTRENREEVLGTLRRLLAGLEEQSKQLQEEMITAMEEDAYTVRKAAEDALARIREAINESFVAIQGAQDERMPL